MEDLIAATARGLGQGSVYALLGVGFVIIYKATEVVNFAQPALMILGGYFTSFFVFNMDLGFWVALPAAMAVTALIGGAVERIALRPMVGRPVFSAAMVTVGVFIALIVVANRLIGTRVLQVGDPWGLRTFELLGARIFHADVAKIVMAMVAIGVVGLFFKYSPAGLAMRATASDQEVALAQGVKVGRMFGLSWALSGALAAIAGMFVGTGGTGLDTTTAMIALKALPAIILGGLDSIPGAVIGGIVIGLAEAFVKTYQPGIAPWLGQNFDQVTPYIVMLIVLMVRPYGLFGTPEIERV